MVAIIGASLKKKNSNKTKQEEYVLLAFFVDSYAIESYSLNIYGLT